MTPDPSAGIFETVLVLAGRPIALEEHLDRLASSTAILYGTRLDRTTGSELQLRLADALGARGQSRPTTSEEPPSWRLRIVVIPERTTGVRIELEQAPAAAGSVFDGSLAVPIELVPTVFEGGLGGHKWLDRRAIARRRAELGIAEQAQLLIADGDGAVLETERANVVAVIGGRLASPQPDGRLLSGVTLPLTFEVAAQLGIEASFRPLSMTDLEMADSLLCTSAVRGLARAGIAGTATSRTGPSDLEEALAAALFDSWGGNPDDGDAPGGGPVARTGATT